MTPRGFGCDIQPAESNMRACNRSWFSPGSLHDNTGQKLQFVFPRAMNGNFIKHIAHCNIYSYVVFSLLTHMLQKKRWNRKCTKSPWSLEPHIFRIKSPCLKLGLVPCIYTTYVHTWAPWAFSNKSRFISSFISVISFSHSNYISLWASYISLHDFMWAT